MSPPKMKLIIDEMKNLLTKSDQLKKGFTEIIDNFDKIRSNEKLRDLMKKDNPYQNAYGRKGEEN